MFRSRTFYITAIILIWGLIILIPFLSKHARSQGTWFVENDSQEHGGSNEKESDDEREAGSGKHDEQKDVKPSELKETENKPEEVEQDNIKDGDIRQGNACLDNMERPIGGQAGTFECHGQGGNQYWFLTKDHLLRNKDFCLEANTSGTEGPVVLKPCDKNVKEQKWEYEGDMLILSGSKMCIDSSGTSGVILKPCDLNSVTQKWKF